jgi:serine/threonine protein kinase/signal transduction histidine kinase/tetratricopeptide (TPR) repeat protein
MYTLKRDFEIITLISEGRDNNVFLTRRKETGEQFLLKSFKHQPAGTGEGLHRKIRFRKEVDMISSFEHPNIARPVDSFLDESGYSILYPYRLGETLAHVLRNRTFLPPDEALSYGLQLLDALEYIHARGIVHCDLNPNNIYINEDRGLELLDFGLSMPEEDAQKLPEGKVLGTMPYLSPEQMGFTSFKIDTRSDLFCVGIMLYRMISGNLPFPDHKGSIEELSKFTLKTEVEPVKNIPAYLNTILLKSLRPTPDDRYQTASGFKYDVEHAILCVREEGKSFVPGERDAVLAVSRSKAFVGRDLEIDALVRGLERLAQGNGSSYLIFGKSGLGKTEIVNRFKMNVNEDATFFLSAKCNRFTSSQPYSIVRHIVLQLLSDITEEGSGEKERFRKILQENLADYSGIICSIMPELCLHFEEVGEIDKVEREKEPERITHVLSQLFVTLTLFKPSVIFVDDFQWIDQISFEVLRRFLALQPACMLIFAFRTEKSEADVFVHGVDLRKIGIKKLLGLKPFSRVEIKDIIASRMGTVRGPEILFDALYSKTDGNPFTVSEALHYLVASSILNYSVLGWGYNEVALKSLPEKFDPISLVLSRLETLNENERRYLLLASLIQGKNETELIERIGGFEREEGSRILRKLENAGFIMRKSENVFFFTHDRVQETLALRLSKEEAFAFNEKIAILYEEKVAVERELIFSAAEYYLKSRNLTKAIEICFEAARYAVEKTAFEIAARYFKNTTFMASQCPGLGLPVTVDLIKVAIEFGNVLMMLGRNQQALNTFLKLLERPDNLEKYQQLEVKYRIGAILHNMGDFENSIRYFTQALNTLNVHLPKNRTLTAFLVLVEIIIQALFSLKVRYLFNKQNDTETSLKIRILNRLSYSCYFQDILVATYVHFKALNIASQINDCFEKGETFVYHIIPMSQWMLKRSARHHFEKALVIANRTNRKDLLAFAENFGGLFYYFASQWNTARKYLGLSINDYKTIGDRWGQITPLEHTGFIAFTLGDFQKCKEIFQREQALGEDCHDLRAITITRRFLLTIGMLENTANAIEWDNLTEYLTQISDSLITATIELTFAQKHLFAGEIGKAYQHSHHSLRTIKQKNLNQEYVASAYYTHCEILVGELLERLVDNTRQQLEFPESKLVHELIFYSRRALMQGIIYPAHFGAGLRCLAWYHFFKGCKRVAGFFFRKAIKRHHVLGMRYEEAKSLRDYGLFLEQCNRPGEARDQFNAAYGLFHECGAQLETGKLQGKVDTFIVQHSKHLPAKEQNGTTSASEISNFRLDTLYEVSASMREIDDIDLLLRQVVSAMIKATGAQYGCLYLEGEKEVTASIPKAIAMNFDGTVLNPESIKTSPKIIQEAKSSKQIVLVGNRLQEDAARHDTERMRSILCVPLFQGENYLGCVYLGNDVVSGVFSETAKKTAQILSAQADVLLRNAFLMDSVKRLNRTLERQVREQTKDIEEKNKQLQENNVKIVESERMKGLLAGTIVHDIKNYTAAIEGNAALLKRQFPNDAKILRTCRMVSEGCTGIVSLSSNLLDIGKMEEGKLVLRMVALTGADIFSLASPLEKNVMFDEKNITVAHVDNSNGLFGIEADIYLVERVLQNIFNNAAKYIPGGGKAVLSLDVSDTESILSFYNSGTPIPEGEKSAIFDKYTRAGGSASQYSKGLGLFFCKMVMNAHGGRIWLETDPSGNSFRLAFKRKIAES